MNVAEQVADAALGIVGVRVLTEEPSHTTRRLTDSVEIRRYESRIAVYILVDCADMTDVVPIAQLRQNPAPALKAVSEGHSLVVTSHNRPVADLVPHQERRGVTPAAFADALRRTRVDVTWADELEAARTDDTDDPWDS